MNTNKFVMNYNLARNQVRLQIGYVEAAFANVNKPITGAQAWWDVVLGTQKQCTSGQLMTLADLPIPPDQMITCAGWKLT